MGLCDYCGCVGRLHMAWRAGRGASVGDGRSLDRCIGSGIDTESGCGHLESVAQDALFVVFVVVLVLFGVIYSFKRMNL